jgi:signal transduction histidine kinase
MSAFPHRWLVSIVFGLLVAFLAASFAVGGHVARIDEHIENIVGNATPSVATLGAVRSEVRELESTMLRALAARPAVRPFARAAIDAQRARVDARLATYEAQPFFEGEARIYASVRESFRDLYAEVERIMAHLETGDFAAAREAMLGPLDVAAQRCDLGLENLSVANNRHAQASAHAIGVVRHRAALLSAALNGGIAAAGLALLMVAIHAGRLHQRALDDWNRERQAKMDDLDRFATRVAHDLRGPLNAMLLSLEVASTSDAATASQLLTRGRRAGLLMAKLIDGLLDLARAGVVPAQRTTTDVASVVASVVEASSSGAKAADVAFIVETVPSSAMVACSAGALTSMIANLVENAIKFTTDATGDKRIFIRVEERASLVHVEVEDTGPGLPAGTEETIFGLYERGTAGNKPGLGIGLATVRRLADVHGGRCGVRSGAGGGACFWFDLPAPAQ